MPVIVNSRVFVIIKLFIINCLLITIILFGCTDNPLFGVKDKFQSKSVIKGKVTLEDEREYSDIFIWLRKFNVSTRTKADGNYTLTLPNPKSLPGGALAWNGEYTLYYYVDNFVIDTIKISILNGELKANQLNVDNNGRVRHDTELKKLVQINTYFSKPWIYNVLTRVRVYIEIKPYRYNGCTLSLIADDQDGPTAFYLCNKDTITNFLKMNMGGRGETKYFAYEHNLSSLLKPVIKLQPGDYKVIPFVHVLQPGLPLDLLDAIGKTGNPVGFNELFLKMPIKVNAQTLWVVDVGR